MHPADEVNTVLDYVLSYTWKTAITAIVVSGTIKIVTWIWYLAL